MATTGELLVLMSSLPSGTAMDHFTHISYGGGGGGTVYVTDKIECDIIQERLDCEVAIPTINCLVEEDVVMCELEKQEIIGEVPSSGAIICEIIETQITGQ